MVFTTLRLNCFSKDSGLPPLPSCTSFLIRLLNARLANLPATRRATRLPTFFLRTACTSPKAFAPLYSAPLTFASVIFSRCTTFLRSFALSATRLVAPVSVSFCILYPGPVFMVSNSSFWPLRILSTARLLQASYLYHAFS